MCQKLLLIGYEIVVKYFWGYFMRVRDCANMIISLNLSATCPPPPRSHSLLKKKKKKKKTGMVLLLYDVLAVDCVIKLLLF